jgi:hypothetical protein
VEEKRGIRSECHEAEMRVALNDAAPFQRDASEARKATGQPFTYDLFDPLKLSEFWRRGPSFA